jgi:hypothetical protein
MSTIISRLLERFVFNVPYEVPEPMMAPEPVVDYDDPVEQSETARGQSPLETHPVDYDTQSESALEYPDPPFEWSTEYPDPPVVPEEPLDFEIDEVSDEPSKVSDPVEEVEPPMKKASPVKPTVPPKPARPMTPSLWQAGNGQYRDQMLNRDDEYIYLVYDFPKKRTDRNHLVTKGALLFVKTKIGWVLPGFVSKVLATGVYPDTGRKFAHLKIKKVENTFAFANKNAALKALGFNELTDNERMHGLIPLYKSV